MNTDPHLSTASTLDVEKDQYLKTLKVGGGKLVTFFAALPRLVLVDGQDRVEQLTPELRQALEDLR